MLEHLLLAAALQARVLTLDDAVTTALAHHPNLAEAAADVQAAEARADQARAALFPTLSGTASLSEHSNAVGGSSQASADPSSSLSGGLTLSRVLYDGGQTRATHRAARRSAEASVSTNLSTRQAVVLEVRTAYFTASAEKAALLVARQTLQNEEEHLRRVSAFVEAGTRPPIDQVQARASLASAKVALIRAENGWQTARLRLNQAMGVVGRADFDVSEALFPVVEGETGELEALVNEAMAARPELMALKRQAAAAGESLRAARGGFQPRVSLSASATESGSLPDGLAFNWSAGLNLSWAIFQGFEQQAQVREATASLRGAEARLEARRQQVRLEVEEAQLGVQTAKEALQASGEAVESAVERLRLAEGRYEIGAGSLIELSDAQLAATEARYQQVEAAFELAAARARLVSALGRP